MNAAFGLFASLVIIVACIGVLGDRIAAWIDNRRKP